MTPVSGPLKLTPEEQAALGGEEGEAVAMATRVIAQIAVATQAERLRPIASAHVDGCIYLGTAGLDFALRLAELGGRVSVPTTLNVGSLDLLHPELFRGSRETATAARRLMDTYVEMGCEATWTCAPYQLRRRPAFGEHIAWAESNAIVFANSVLGARTDRYGDLIDICAAILGRVPDAGLHRDENRRGEVVFDLTDLGDELLGTDVIYPVLGHLVGKESEGQLPVLDGLPANTDEDRLRALGAGAASSGGVAMFHAVGSTPEAPTLADALGDRPSKRTVAVTPESARASRDDLGSMPPGTKLDAVSIGTPHFSVREFGHLDRLLRELRIEAKTPFYVSTSRFVLDEARRRGFLDSCERAGMTIVTDTCTYNTSILHEQARTAMTNSAKWAYYAPTNIGVSATLGSLRECVLSAGAGCVTRSDSLWG